MSASLDWAGCATFRLTLGDMVVLLDAYLDRPATAVPTGLSVDAVERADWILVGHSHADHLWGAERIAVRTGATIVGSYETVRVMAALGVPLSQLVYVSGGERVRLADEVFVSVFPSMHACAWAGHGMVDSGSVCLGDLGVDWHEQQARWKAMAGSMGELANANPGVLDYVGGRKTLDYRGDGGPLVYLIETPEGSLLYQDTAGYWTGMFERLHPDVAILAATGRGNVDGEPVQGSLAQHLSAQATLLQPERLILCHHDDWMPGMSVAVDTGPIRDLLGERNPTTELVQMGYVEGYPLF